MSDKDTSQAVVEPGFGWRLLEVGEIIKPGDEFWSGCEWVSRYDVDLGSPFIDGWMPTRRRKDATAAQPVTPNQATHESVCQEADRIVSTDRQQSYDHPYENFTRTGIMWAPVLEKWAKDTQGSAPIPPELVGLCMELVKVAREVHRPKRDNRTDGCGYWKCVDLVHERRAELQRNVTSQ